MPWTNLSVALQPTGGIANPPGAQIVTIGGTSSINVSLAFDLASVPVIFDLQLSIATESYTQDFTFNKAGPLIAASYTVYTTSTCGGNNAGILQGIFKITCKNVGDMPTLGLNPVAEVSPNNVWQITQGFTPVVCSQGLNNHIGLTDLAPGASLSNVYFGACLSPLNSPTSITITFEQPGITFAPPFQFNYTLA